MIEHQGNKAGNDLLRIFYRLTGYWLLFLVSLVIALSLAFAYVRYTEAVYKVSTSILLRDDSQKDAGMASLFKELGIGSGKKNLENEIEVLKSTPLIKKAIERLDFKVFYFAEGNISTTEIYHKNPFIVSIDTLSEEFINLPIYIKKLNQNEYQLYTQNEKAFFDPDTRSFSQKNASSLPLRCNLQFGITYPIDGTRFSVSCNKKALEEFDKNSSFFFIYTDPRAVAENYKSRLNIRQTNKMSTILDMSLTGKSLLKETDFLNKLVEVYMEGLLDQKNQVASNTIKFIDDQLTGITVSLQDAEEELKYFRANNKIMDLSFAASNAFTKLDALETEKATEEVKRKYYEYLLKYVKENSAVKDVVAPSSIGIADPLLTSLIQQLSKLGTEKSVLAISAKEKNPSWFVLEDKINSVKKELIENIRGLIANSRITSDDLGRRIAVLEKSVNQLPDNERKLVNIQRKFNLNDNIYTYLLQKRAEAGISRAANMPDCQVVEKADAGTATLVAPKKLVVFSMALFFGLMLPALFAFARIWLNDKILSKEDLENESNIPIVGMVGNKTQPSNLVTYNNPRSPITEDFRSIKLNLPYVQPNRDLKVICVTSSVPGEGKTFCSVNLASVFALSGKRTLVLFADLRRPRIDKDLAVNTEMGLSNILIGRNTIDQVVQESSIPNLFVLPAGPTPPNPAELLGTPLMRQTIEVLKKDFDIIVIDTPPIGLVSDTLLMLEYSDANCYIVRHNYTRKIFLRKINEMYDEKRIQNVCLIINDIEGESVGYGYGYGYRYGGYGYQYGYFEEKEESLWKKISGGLFKKGNNS